MHPQNTLHSLVEEYTPLSCRRIVCHRILRLQKYEYAGAILEYCYGATNIGTNFKRLFEDKGSIRSMSEEDLELHRLNLCFEST